MNMTESCAPTYNFYHCCGDPKSGATQKSQFIWRSENTFSFLTNGGSDDKLHGGGFGQWVDADKTTFLSMEPIHRKCALAEISVLRFKTPNITSTTLDIDPSYAAFVNFEIVVMDMFGTVIRTISTTPLDYKLISDKIWTNIPLSSNLNDLIISPNEIVASKVTFGAPMPGKYLLFRLSGIGELV
jgi:hypothetical protein